MADLGSLVLMKNIRSHWCSATPTWDDDEINKVSFGLLSMCDGHCRRASPLSYGLRLSGLEHGLVLTVWGFTLRKVLHIPQSGYSYLEEYERANFRRSYMYPTLRYVFSKHFGSPHTKCSLVNITCWPTCVRTRR